MGSCNRLIIPKKSKYYSVFTVLITLVSSTLIIPHGYIVSAMTGDYHGDVSLTDLQLKQFESWWSPINNGTIFIRYVVMNVGSTYEDMNQPILLNISFSLNSSEDYFSYINQQSYLDPYVWYNGESLSGCIHVPLDFKPDYIYAKINSKKSIPEMNYTNNIQRTSVVNGIHISGYVNRDINGTKTAAEDVSIRRCNSSSLEPNLSIRFDTDNTGRFDVVLFPQEPFNESFQYDLLCTNKKTSQVLHVRTKPISQLDENYTIELILQENTPPTPNKIHSFPVWIQNTSLILITKINKYEESRFYKIKWETGSYSDWIGPCSNNQLFLLTHTWDNKGIKSVKIISKNNEGLLSEWSESKMILII